MRKSLGVVLAVATLLSTVLLVGVTPAGAAGGTTCKTNTGTATFTPPLPPLSSSATVNSTVNSSGTLSGCVGGGVTGGTYKLSYKDTTSHNCKQLLTYTTKTTTATITTTWSNHKTSVGTITLIAIKGNPTKSNVTGVTKTGLFAGLHTTTSFAFKAVPATGCTSTPLAKVAVTGASAVVIR
jgi:hypothetical protein